MSKLLMNYSLKLDYRKVDQYTGGQHTVRTKHRRNDQL